MAAKKSNYLDLLEKIKETSTLSQTTTLSETKLLNEKDFVPTGIPILNVPFSGSLNGGISSGVTIIAGVSKNFKTGLLLLLMRAYLKHHKDGVALFYCSEFGSPIHYFDAFDIDKDKVIISPVTKVEELKIDCSQQLEAFKRGDKVFIGVDSLGNLASMKEVDDAQKGETTTDMTRAKAFKSLFRIITPTLTLKNIPFVGIGHTYKTQEKYAKDVVGGGTGAYYSADNVFIIGREKDKDGDLVVGNNFTVKVDKGRFTKEGSKFVLNVGYDSGVSKWSGLLDEAVGSGHVIKKKESGRNIFYKGDKAYTEEETNTGEFWNSFLADKTFNEAIEKKYKLGNTKMIDDSDV